MRVAESFPVWLGRQLQRRGWSQADFSRELSKAAGKRISTGLVSNWLSGARRPSSASCELIADVLFVDVDEVLAIAGHRPRLPMDQLEKFHSLADPYAKHLDWDDPEVQLAIVGALEQQIRIKELREGTRTQETFFAPVEVDEEEG